MNHLLSVSLIAIVLAVNVSPNVAGQSGAMQEGIRVQQPLSTNPVPMPDADNEDAFIVTVTENGNVYLGVNRSALSALPEKVASTPFKHGQKVFIKADARTSYAKVLQVLNVTQTGGIAPQALLVAQQESLGTRLASPQVWMSRSVRHQGQRRTGLCCKFRSRERQRLR
ncbi:MAG TPA: biopolymer transporter ExbD [Candidatus Sulfotelmatobacter sp.]